MDSMNEQFERANGDAFIVWLNAKLGTKYSFSHRPDQAPDLAYSYAGDELLVEVTAAYYDASHAAFLWQSKDSWLGENPDKSLSQEVADRIEKKSQKTYGSCCILLVVVPPGVTPVETLTELLAQQVILDNMPFVGVYAAGRFPITESSEGGYRVIPIKELAN